MTFGTPSFKRKLDAYLLRSPPEPIESEYGECFDCHHVFKEHEEQFEDTMKNPMCGKCRDKLTEKAEALLDAMREEEALKREMDGRKQDARETKRINGRW